MMKVKIFFQPFQNQNLRTTYDLRIIITKLGKIYCTTHYPFRYYTFNFSYCTQYYCNVYLFENVINNTNKSIFYQFEKLSKTR